MEGAREELGLPMEGGLQWKAGLRWDLRLTYVDRNSHMIGHLLTPVLA